MESEEKQRTSVFINNKEQHIFYRNWRTGSRPKGIVLIVHGLNSHSGYYQNFALLLNAENYEAYAIDLRGRGNSEGERYYIADYTEIISDIDQLVDIIQAASPDIPLFLLGHSAGGVFASVYAIKGQSRLKGLISESFAFQVPAPGFAKALIKFLARVIPHVRVVSLNNEDFSRDILVVNAINSDPLLKNEKQPAKTMQQLFYAAEVLKGEMPEIKLPLLILHGTADKVTVPAGSEYFMEYAGSADRQLKLYEGHYHDLLNDKYNRIIIKDIMRWLNERT